MADEPLNNLCKTKISLNKTRQLNSNSNVLIAINSENSVIAQSTGNNTPKYNQQSNKPSLLDLKSRLHYPISQSRVNWTESNTTRTWFNPSITFRNCKKQNTNTRFTREKDESGNKYKVILRDKRYKYLDNDSVDFLVSSSYWCMNNSMNTQTASRNQIRSSSKKVSTLPPSQTLWNNSKKVFKVNGGWYSNGNVTENVVIENKENKSNYTKMIRKNKRKGSLLLAANMGNRSVNKFRKSSLISQLALKWSEKNECVEELIDDRNQSWKENFAKFRMMLWQKEQKTNKWVNEVKKAEVINSQMWKQYIVKIRNKSRWYLLKNN